MKFTDICRVLDEIAPLRLAEDWDNSGVQLYSGNGDISRILCAMEINDAVIDEAERKGAGLIVTHHPLLLDGIRNFSVSDVPSRYILRLAKLGISAYAAHTCFDVADGGINDYLAKLIGLENVRKACPLKAEDPDTMLFRIGEVQMPCKLSEYAEFLKTRLSKSPGLRVCGDPERIIRKVCVCGGSGGSYWREALAEGADLYITGELKHHDAGPALDSGLCLIDATHAGTECWFTENMAEKLRRSLGDEVLVLESESEINPFKFTV